MTSMVLAFVLASSTVTLHPTAASAVAAGASASVERSSVADMATVAFLYRTLLKEPVAKRSRQLSEMTGATQAAIWAYHLRSEMAQHPEFTAAQKAVIELGLSVMTPELSEIDSTHPDWSARVDTPLRVLTERAKAVFPLEVARRLFAQLGPDDAVSAFESCNFD